MGDIPEWVLDARSKWRFRGRQRPGFAAAPGPGQESVWDYPRPPRMADDEREIVVMARDALIARTGNACRVLETASPPSFYLPRDDIRPGVLAPGKATSLCEWKGAARYWHATVDGQRFENVAWSYEDPWPGYEILRGRTAFYAAPLACFVAGIRVEAQPGSVYGGWVTPELTGPFKGEPGSEWW